MRKIHSAISSRLPDASWIIGSRPDRASASTAAWPRARSCRHTMTRSWPNWSSTRGTGGKRSSTCRAASTHSRSAGGTRTGRSIERCFAGPSSPRGICGPRWSRTCASRTVSGAAARGRNASPRLPRPSSRAVARRAGRPSCSSGLRRRSGRWRDGENGSWEVAMRFRLDVDGEERDIEVQPMAGGVIIRIDGAAYRARTRLAKEAVDVRIRAKTLRLRFQGAEAVLDDGIHRVRLVEVTGEGPDVIESPAGPGAVVEVRSSMPGRVVRVAVSPGGAGPRGGAPLGLGGKKKERENSRPPDRGGRHDAAPGGGSRNADRGVAPLELRR